MSKLQLEDTLVGIITKMSEGNPGAISALMAILQEHEAIDPQAASPLLTIFQLDDMGIYGSSIYILWSDKAQRDTRKLLVLLRAVQLGFLSGDKLKEMAEDQMRSVDLTVEEYELLDAKVTKQLEGFKKAS